MANNPLSIRVAAIELSQRDGHPVTKLDSGVLAAAKRHGDPELKTRAEAIELVERRRVKRKKAQAEDEPKGPGGYADLLKSLTEQLP